MKTQMRKNNRTKVTALVFFNLFLFFPIIIATSLGQSGIVKSLPGYPGDLPFVLETGYVGVGESEKVQLFYYFIESERDVERDPLILWLTGGPGCSALSGLIFEIGPLKFNLTATNSDSDRPKLQQNPYSWTTVASIIFLDSPVGTGFSYATTSEAFDSSDTLQSAHIYEFLRNWLIAHPKFTKIPLYVAGDSYSGAIVPIVVHEFLQGNDIGKKPKLNLKGYVLGNAITIPYVSANGKYKFAHRVSLLSDELYKSAIMSCKGDFADVDAENKECLHYLQAMEQDIDSVNAGLVVQPKCSLNKLSPHKYQSIDHLLGLPSGLNNKEDDFCVLNEDELAYSWVSNEKVREALHIREGSIGVWVRCNQSLSYEYNSKSSVLYHKEFLREPLQVLIYSGDQDMLAPYIGTLQWINELEVPITNEWRPWFIDDQVAGYVTEFSRSPYRLIFTTIKGGSHVAPEHKPRECFAMIERWLSLASL